MKKGVKIIALILIVGVLSSFFLQNIKDFALFTIIILLVIISVFFKVDSIYERQGKIILLLQDIRWRLDHPKEVYGEGHYLTRPIVPEDIRKKQKEDLKEFSDNYFDK